MKCLAVNTATAELSVALVDGEEVLHLYRTSEMRGQSNLLALHMQEAMQKKGLKYEDLDLLAAVTGPGSFTGIRIGLAAMRGVALAAGVAVTGLTSFELFSVEEEGKRNLVVMESWREELYFQLEGLPPVNKTPEDFIASIPELNFPLLISGDAAEKMKDLLPDAEIYQGEMNAATAAQIAMQQREYTKPVPFYLRPPDISKPKKG